MIHWYTAVSFNSYQRVWLARVKNFHNTVIKEILKRTAINLNHQVIDFVSDKGERQRSLSRIYRNSLKVTSLIIVRMLEERGQ